MLRRLLYNNNKYTKQQIQETRGHAHIQIGTGVLPSTLNTLNVLGGVCRIWYALCTPAACTMSPNGVDSSKLLSGLSRCGSARSLLTIAKCVFCVDGSVPYKYCNQITLPSVMKSKYYTLQY